MPPVTTTVVAPQLNLNGRRELFAACSGANEHSTDEFTIRCASVDIDLFQHSPNKCTAGASFEI